MTSGTRRTLSRTAQRLAVGTALIASALASAALVPASASASSAPPPANCKTTNGQLPTASGSNLAAGCFSLSVSPARISLSAAAPKKAYTQTFQVTNNGNTDYAVQVFAIDYTQDLNGSLIQTKSSEDASWVSLSPSTLNLVGAFDKSTAGKSTAFIAAHSTQPVRIHITPNPHATPGDHQIAIIFRKPADPNAGNIKVAPQIGAQVLIQVPGKVTYGLKLSDGSLATKSSGLLGLGGSTGNLALDVHNLGNIHSDFFTAQNITATTTGFGAPGAVVGFPQFTVLRELTHRVSNVSVPKAASWYGCWSCSVNVTAHITSPATLVSAAQSPNVKWSPLKGASSYNILRNGVAIATVSAGQTSFTDPHPITSGGGIAYTVSGVVATASETIPYSVIPWPLIIAAVVLLVLLVGFVVWRVKTRKTRTDKRAAERELERQKIRDEEREKVLREQASSSQAADGGNASTATESGSVATLAKDGAPDGDAEK